MIHPIVSPRAQVRMMGLRSSRVDRVSETVTSEWSFAQRPSLCGKGFGVAIASQTPPSIIKRVSTGRIRNGIVIKGKVF